MQPADATVSVNHPTVVYDLVPDRAVRGATPVAAGLVESLYVLTLLLGVLTAVGGGVARDILVSEVPAVLRADLYAIAALAGAAFVVIGRALGLPADVATIIGAALCIGLRITAMQRHWQLPVARAGRGNKDHEHG